MAFLLWLKTLDWLSIIGTLASIVGLIVSWLAFMKIKQVNDIIRQKTINRTLNTSIETVMKYAENQPLSPENIRNIKYLMTSINTLIKKNKNEQQIEKTQIAAITSEVEGQSPNIVNIKNSLKIIKPLLVNQEK